MTAFLFSKRREGGRPIDLNDGQPAASAADYPRRAARGARSGIAASRSSRRRCQVSNPNQVVGGEGKREHPVDAAGAPVPRLAHQPDRLEPTEDLLTHCVARMADGPAVDRAAALVVFCATCGVTPSRRAAATKSRVSCPLSAPSVTRPPASRSPEQLQRRRARRSRWRG